MSDGFTPAHRAGTGEPLVLLHGFTDTWRTWELVLPHLTPHHDVLALTLTGHAGGPRLDGDVDGERLAADVERAMDEAGFATAHLAGNSLGGFVALQLAARGRARSVVAFAPAGGWADADPGRQEVFLHFARLRERLQAAAAGAAAIAASTGGRRLATQHITVNFEHLPAGLVAHQIRGAAHTDADAFIEHALVADWALDTGRITCPVRVVWGAEDRLLPWPASAARFRTALPHADWIALEGVGHCPQLDVPEQAARLLLDITGA